MNLGIVDRFIRLSTGVFIVVFDYLANANWEILFLFFGLWGVLTSVLGWCPFYNLVGANTCSRKFSDVENDTIIG